MPPYTYILIAVVLGFTIYGWIARRRAAASSTHATLGAVAQRLGLQIAKGDPKLNLYYLSQPNRNYKRNIQMVGAPYGRPVTWDLTDGTRTQDFLVAVKVTTTWGCFFVAQVAAQFPEFEITLRNPNQYLVPERLMSHLPEAPTGDPAIDGAYRVAIADPRWAPALVGAIRALSGQLYVHLVGQGQVVMVPITRVGISYFANAAEQYLFALETAACALEGKPAPATLAAPSAAGPTPYVSPYGA